MRLDKFISNNTEFSRSEVRQLVKAKRIVINGQTAHSSDMKVEEAIDQILLDGQAVQATGKVYIMLHKPAGYICANTDSQHPTVLDLLQKSHGQVPCPKPILFKDFQIAGRLDLDTTGLVFITNDGDWNHRITSPGMHCKKIYRVRLHDTPPPETEQRFAEGILLDGEKKITRPAELERIDEKTVRLHLSEGKYHQVKRMFAAIGNHVIALHRESIAGITLDENLEPGQFRYLRADELALMHDHFKPT